MNNLETRAIYLRQLVEEKKIPLFYQRNYDQIVDVFTKLVVEAQIMKLQEMLRLQGAILTRGCENIIPPLESQNICVDEGVLK